MSSIHWQPERSTTSAPEGQGTPVATEPQATRLTPLSQSLIEQFMQQVSPTQGQLPTALAQSLQTLLRQMPLLSLQLGVEVTTVNPSQATEDRNPAMQWLNRLVPILLRMEPSLRLPVPIPLAPSEPAPTTLSTGQPALPPTSPHDSTLLQLLQQQPPLGRALLHWALQLLSQHPKLMAQFSTQEQQQFRQQTKVTLPPTANTQAANKSDSFTLSPRQLPVLLRATLPLLQNQTTESAKAAISQPQGDPKTNTPPASASSAKAPMAQTQPQDASPDKTHPAAASSTKAPTNSVSTAMLLQSPPLGRVLLQGVKTLLQTTHRLPPAGATAPTVPPAATTAPTAPPAAAGSFPKGQLSWTMLLKLAGLPADATAASIPLNETIDDQTSPESALPQLVRLLHGSASLALPRSLQANLMQLAADLQRPLDSPQQVEQWLRFMSAPLANDSPLGQGLQRWLTQLLSQRLAQATPSDTTRPPPAPAQDEHQINSRVLNRLGDASLQLVEQRQTAHHEITAPNQPWLCPLPVTPQQPHEPALTIQRGGKTEQEYHWLLSFYLEPDGVGPLQIKVRLQIPDIGIMVIAEQANGAERVKQTLPDLEARFASLGLQSTGFHCRQGKVKPPQRPSPPATDGLSIHI